ncbi:MAG: hypothetical protein ACRDPO_33990 [Streptosporangiaceae bacterium]
MQILIEYPVVQILIDGQARLASVGGQDYWPWPSAAILGDGEPLPPAATPRRVVLCRAVHVRLRHGRLRQPGPRHRPLGRPGDLERLPSRHGHGRRADPRRPLFGLQPGR